jgi:CRP/FNR family transcriptional regulator
MQVATAVQVPTQARAASVRPLRPLLHEVGRERVSCVTCNLRRICMPVDIVDPETKALFESLVSTRVRLRKGDVLFRSGDRFTGLFAIRSGSMKTVTASDDGAELVSAYHLQGEIVGVEGLGNDVYACNAVALEDTEVCTLPNERK